MKKILILHGPCLHLLGQRENSTYGMTTLLELDESLIEKGRQQGVQVWAQQANSEERLIELLTGAMQEKIDCIIFNPAAFTHTSIALRDCLLAIKIPFIEVHISNIYARESFRHHSYFRDIAAGSIIGFGTLSYQLALDAAVALVSCET